MPQEDAEGVKATMRGIRRTHGSARVAQNASGGRQDAWHGGDSARQACRLADRALLLIGFGGALRRSELVALDVADIAETETGLLVTIRHSKTDQEGEGATIAIAHGDVACPVKALRAWLDASGIQAGPILPPDRQGGCAPRGSPSVANIVKAYAARAGFDARTFSGHSLRAGFLTSAAGKGASIFKMMDVSRHKSVDTLRGYVRDAELFKDHAEAGLL
jgi:integrase